MFAENIKFVPTGALEFYLSRAGRRVIRSASVYLLGLGYLCGELNLSPLPCNIHVYHDTRRFIRIVILQQNISQ